MKLRNGFLLAAIAAGVLFAAAPPYAGSWKLNAAKSDMAGTTMGYQKLPSGEWQATADGINYKFKMDGKEYPDNLGDTVAWKEAGADSWQAEWKVNGKMIAQDSVKLAGNVLTIHSTGTKPNGDKLDSTTTFERVSGGPGLAGKWRTKTTQSGSPEVIELVASGDNGLTYRDVSFSMSCDGKLDGKDYACAGPTVAPGWTVAMTKTGDRTFSATVKKDGKPLYKFNYTPSADAKMLTVTGGAVATNEKIKMVYDRQ